MMHITFTSRVIRNMVVSTVRSNFYIKVWEVARGLILIFMSESSVPLASLENNVSSFYPMNYDLN